MILQALKEYYDRKAADALSNIAPEGFETKELPFLVVIKTDGEFVQLEDTRQFYGKKLLGKSFQLPRSIKRSGSKSYETTFLLWDHIGYLFQYPEQEPKAKNQHGAWKESLNCLPDSLKKDMGVAAVLAFYLKDEVEKVKTDSKWQECIKIPSCNMTFRLVEDVLPVPCRPAVRQYVETLLQGELGSDNGADEDKIGYCLITGELAKIARTHGRTPINKDTKSLVAFQRNAGYDSYGKEQCYNAPVSKAAEFAYVTGLNTLLKARSQRMQIGDATTVFWSANATEFEHTASLFFTDPRKDDPSRDTEAVRELYESIWTGKYVVPDDTTNFYVLGLSPNSARIAVRFWHVAPISKIGATLKKHVDDLAIISDKNSKSDPALPIYKLLRSIAVAGKDDNIPPNIAGGMMSSILEGTPYPMTLFQAVLRRIRAEREVTHPRAAIIKACLNRLVRFRNHGKKEEITVSLDTGNTNIGYRLGRLFAVLEKCQEDASPGINATIRDRFYGAASSTPVTVFGNLVRLSQHHLAKMENIGLRIVREKLIQEIMAEIIDFPAHLSIADQGRFAIGYYHQRQEFFSKKTETTVV